MHQLIRSSLSPVENTNNATSAINFFSMAIELFNYWFTGKNFNVTAQVQSLVESMQPAVAYSNRESMGESLSAYHALRSEPIHDFKTRQLTGPLGSEFQVNTYNRLDGQEWPAIAALTDGGFVVTWDCFKKFGSDYGICGQCYAENGTKKGAEFQVNTYIASNQIKNSAVAALTEGGFVVTWDGNGQDGSGHEIYGQRYAANGAKDGAEFQVNTYTAIDQMNPAVAALTEGGFVVTWNSKGQDGQNYGIYGQRYATSGAKDGTEFQVNTYPKQFKVCPAIAALTNGEFVVVWDSEEQDGSGFGVYGQRCASSGAKIDYEFQVNTYTKSHQMASAIAALTNGGFVVTWSSEGQEGSRYGFYGIYGQRYAANGAKDGTEFQVNTYTLGLQFNSAVSALTEGGFVVTWDSEGEQDGSGTGIYGQRYTANGAKIGEEFQVNTYAQNHQIGSAIAALINGGFVVTWGSYLQDGYGDGIYGQKFDANGNKIPLILTPAPTPQPTKSKMPWVLTPRPTPQPTRNITSIHSRKHAINFFSVGVIAGIAVGGCVLASCFCILILKVIAARPIKISHREYEKPRQPEPVIKIEKKEIPYKPIPSDRQKASHPKEQELVLHVNESLLGNEPDASSVNKGNNVLYILRNQTQEIRLLGSGSYGDVYYGLWKSQKVALKLYKNDCYINGQEGIPVEVEIMRHLENDYLVKLIGLVQDGISPTKMVMEYAENESLNKYLHDPSKIMPLNFQLRIASDLTEGLAYLHSKNIIHRDLKSDNAVLGNNYRAKWCDFGLAIFEYQDGRSRSPVGTLNWRAPELYDPEYSSKKASDVWALGMVFFELIRREIPFNYATDDAHHKQIVQEHGGEDITPEEVQKSPQFIAIIQRCWNMRSSHRPEAKNLVDEIQKTILHHGF